MMAPPPIPCRARAHQHRHRFREAAEQRADEKEHDRRLIHRFAAEDVTHLADHGGDHRRCKKIAGHHPGLTAGTTEIGDDGGQCGGDDGLVERRQQRAEQNRDKHQVAPAGAEQRAAGLLICGYRWARHRILLSACRFSTDIVRQTMKVTAETEPLRVTGDSPATRSG